MVYYIKTTPEVAKRFASLELRNALKDGNIALWMSDLDAVPGDTLAERAAYVGGSLLTPKECADEFFGRTTNYAQCYTPEYYGGKGSTTKDTNDTENSSKDSDVNPSGKNSTNANGNASGIEAKDDSNYSASAFTPKVEGSVSENPDNTDSEKADETEEASSDKNNE